MPRKNARPAARKKRAKLKAAMENPQPRTRQRRHFRPTVNDYVLLGPMLSMAGFINEMKRPSNEEPN